VILGVFWVRLRLQEHAHATLPRRGLDVLVVAVSALRLAGPLVPFSGHMLFLTYTMLTTPVRWYRVAAALLAVQTTLFKFGLAADPPAAWYGLFLRLWDPTGWWTGILAGLVAGMLYRGGPSRQERR
jgi:hypothetical protein